MIKKTIFFLSIIALVGGIFVAVYYDKSRPIYLEALELHNKGEDRRAYAKVQEAMKVNTLNRKAILLQAKLHKIVTGEDNFKAAEDAYRESMQNYFDEEYLLAVHKISESYDLLGKIPSDAPVYKKAMQLQTKVDKEIDNIQKKLPELYFKKAKELANKKQYSAAYEYMLKLDQKDENVINYKNKLAYKIGTARYSKVMSNTDNVSAHEIADAIYWLSNVTEASSSYSFAEKQIRILDTLLKQQEK